MKKILQINNLSKCYKKFLALDDVSFAINQGEIFGLIGENGAGKTTLMRVIAGCSKATNGTIELFGKTGFDLTQMRKQMGIIIESPACYGDMTAFENLEIIRLAKGNPDKTTIFQALNAVGLQAFPKRKVSKFSLGMKQRLGLAMALINSPKFLILDEPINGLDPKGIIDIRNIILHLNREQNVTFLISSHILPELNQIATHYGFLNKGRLIAQHTTNELEKQCKKQYLIKHQDNGDYIVNFIKKFGVESISIDGNLITFTSVEDIPNNFLTTLISQNFKIIEYHIQRESLENYFVRLIKRNEDE